MAVLGLVAVIMSLFGLPWVSAGGRDVSFPDIREIYDDLPAGADGPAGGATGDDYMEVYAGGLWVATLLFAALAVLVATLLVPTSPVARVLVGCITFGVVGAIVMAADKKGTAGPRICGVFMAIVAGALHGFAVFALFDGPGPSPAYGVWLGFLGVAAIVVGSLMGTRTAPAPPPTP
ncbi:MAG TPA: hypothetical protein VIL36_02185, partial [Acidimicrobiales bacterium]